MNKRRLIGTIFVLLLLFVYSTLGYAGLGETDSISKQRSQTQQDQVKGQSPDANKKIAQLLRTSYILENLASKSMKEALRKEQIKEVQRYNRWLRKTSKEIKQFVNHWQSKFRGSKNSKQMLEMQMGFNLQYLHMQNKIAHENRQFTMVSNIMKNKHDTAKNAINNIR